MKAELINLQNEKVGEIELPEEIFSQKWNPVLVKQVLDAQLANSRDPIAHAKTRGEVRGGGKKPWRQKGTGRARHGSIRSPIWVGGGKAHGPSKDKDFSKKINKKMKRLAIFSVLSKKLKDNEIKFFDSLNISEPKTKIVFSYLKNILNLPKRAKKTDVLLIPDLENKNIYKAARNILKTKVLSPISLNVYDLLNYKNIFIDKNSLEIIVKHYKI
ncbi:MAG: 50S ribosomal protein L4 [Patescibacteria group bacterium]|nr:50S ribosomal protein L4 [Patescibacteria group bacterium]MCX7589902.1 50S ribosomal protein L4 [Patescibacteria group bacterium]MDW8279582.1 50S ribosomal protein L4 [bacterium]